MDREMRCNFAIFDARLRPSGEYFCADNILLSPNWTISTPEIVQRGFWLNVVLALHPLEHQFPFPATYVQTKAISPMNTYRLLPAMSLVAVLGFGFADAIAGPLQAAAANVIGIVRISTTSTGTQANGPSSGAVFSPDGTMVAFESNASNLVLGDGNNTYDVFLKNLTTGVITCVSTNAKGKIGNGSSSHPRFSPDGKSIVFQSSASNFVAGDTNGFSDIFIKTLATGAIKQVSRSKAGIEGNGYSINAVFSPDGTKVAFESTSGTLIPNGFGNVASIYVKDLTTNSVTRVSQPQNGTDPDKASFTPVFSPDGKTVAYASLATNLVVGDTNGFLDVFSTNLATGVVSRKSKTSAGKQTNGQSSLPIYAPDGKSIAFFSDATNIVTGDTNNKEDMFLRTLSSNQVVRISTDANGVEGNEITGYGVFSSNGLNIVFEDWSSNLVAGDTNGGVDIFFKTLSTGAITRISTKSNHQQAQAGSRKPAISADGKHVAFESTSTDLVLGDTNGVSDIFVVTLQ